MTYRGGVNDLGTIFKIKQDGTEFKKLLDFNGFAGTATGGHPEGSLVSDGTYLYGMTRDGGVNGIGVIFKIKIPHPKKNSSGHGTCTAAPWKEVSMRF